MDTRLAMSSTLLVVGCVSRDQGNSEFGLTRYSLHKCVQSNFGSVGVQDFASRTFQQFPQLTDLYFQEDYAQILCNTMKL